MKKFTTFLLSLLLLIISSCASDLAIPIKVLEPAEINMSKYKTIAVLSTKPYSKIWYPSFSSYLPFRGSRVGRDLHVSHYNASHLTTEIAKHAQENFIKVLNQASYFDKIIEPNEADLIFSKNYLLGISQKEIIENNKIDAFVDSEISYLDFDEWLEEEPEYSYRTIKNRHGKERTERHLERIKYKLYTNIKVSFTYKIIEAKTGKLVGERTISDSSSKCIYIDPLWTMTQSPSDSIRNLLDSIDQKVIKQLVPHWITEYIEPMENKPENLAAKAAWSLINEGRFIEASIIFDNAWQKDKHIPSGYNAVLCYQSQGDTQKASQIIQELYETAPTNEKVAKLYGKYSLINFRTNEALKQL